MTEPTTPAGWGIQMSRLWMASGQSFPVDVKLLALEVTPQRFSDPVGLIKPHGVPGIDGMLSRRRRGDWCISYDEGVTVPGRINFTLAHELGHYFCHRALHEQFSCAQGAMLDYQGDVSRRMEREANVFASFLLMPANDFRQQIEGQAITLELLGEVANRYGTSFTATALRWLEITHEAAILVVTRDEFVCWSYPSKSASNRSAYLPPGTPVPQSAIARSMAAEGQTKNSRCSVSAGIWHSSLEAEESVIVSDQFELTIFLVRYPEASLVLHEEEPTVDAFDQVLEGTIGFGRSA